MTNEIVERLTGSNDRYCDKAERRRMRKEQLKDLLNWGADLEEDDDDEELIECLVEIMNDDSE